MNLGQPIVRGNTAEIYLCDGKIIKVFHDHLPYMESKYEADKQRFACSCGLPVPQVLDVTHVNGKQAIIMEYIKGTTIGDLMRQNTHQTESFLAHSVSLQIEIHSKSVTAHESMKEKLSRQLYAASILDEPCRVRLLERLEGLLSENQLCHGDYHVFNLIKAKNQTFIIDWVDSSAGNPCADAYRTYLLYSQFESHWAETYLRLYCDKTGFSHKDIFAWAPIIAGARLSENVSSESADRLLGIIRQYV